MSFLHVVTLRSMAFHAHVGALPHEAEIAQSIEVDLSVWVPRAEGAKAPDGIVDYRVLYNLVAEIVEEGHIHYLETLAERIVTAALDVGGVARVRVSVRKPHVLLPGPLASAEVTLEQAAGE